MRLFPQRATVTALFGVAVVAPAPRRAEALTPLRRRAASPAAPGYRGGVTRGWRWFRMVGKPLLMPALAARFATAPRGSGTEPVLLAQACSWAGDLALNGRSRRSFLTGLTCFLAAHLAYLAAFRARSSVPVAGTPGRRRLLLAGGGGAAGMALAAGRRDRALAAPVAAYGATLTALVAAAAAIDRDQGRDQVLTGAVLFLISDTLIGVREFLVRDRRAGLEVAVMATYAAAQWHLAEGMSTRPGGRVGDRSGGRSQPSRMSVVNARACAASRSALSASTRPRASS